MIRFILYVKQIIDKFSKDEMSVYAAQASFFIILAAFPFLMLLLSLIQLIPFIHEADFIMVLLQLIPDTLDSLVVTIIDTLYSGSPVAILSVTAVTALWSSSRGMLSIERGLNRVYGITVQRNYILRRIICSGYTVVFTAVCILSLVLLVFGEILQKQLVKLLPFLSRFSFLISQGRTLFTLLILIVFFTGIYTCLPYQKQRVRYQFPGAFFATAGWTLFSMAFSIYFKYFKSYANMYGSLTALVLLMLWLYFCICILFMGAEINWHFKHYHRNRDE